MGAIKSEIIARHRTSVANLHYTTREKLAQTMTHIVRTCPVTKLCETIWH